MSLLRKTGRWGWWLVVVMVMGAAVLLLLINPPRQGPGGAATPAAVAPSHSNEQTMPAAAPIAETPTADSAIPAGPIGEPRTTNYRTLATAAAQAIYTWDSRTASYSEIYSRLRAWWEVLPDGSNPLAVLAQEFEDTGVTAGTFGTLSGQDAYRTGTAESIRCDGELAKVTEHPAPWVGLHVCTVSVSVVDQSANSRNAYIAPVSVMINCPPAVTAPPDRCAMVGFYTSLSRIVY